MTWLLFGLIVALIVVFVIYGFIQMNKVKREGIAADAFVSRINVDESTDSDGMTTTTKKYYIRYTAQEGKMVEARLANPRKGLVIGDRIKVKYLPDKPGYALMVD